ncbi:nucleotide-binding universal stress UspA family protein [Hymenobacter luteus]|uniref:Nucleotide-binding universal stress UspA family protein n=2 Tax=Hymenobacter TaxID=89966 RepID=A0A7W9T031_9BACT|nr:MULTISPECIES: universal stress protein [Hymenobacter]MBB4601414.1 nucleotide-binding universal stress UspA family protein [Hymenobacter latericoloratus]MBB6058379.1 nucleotide-binding universal stress UspA family protein [Hymenobacter luteus]
MATSLLLLTDFFQAAGRALAYATNLAEPLQARLVLLHVRRDSVLDPEMFSGQLSNLSREAIALALQSVTRQLRVPVVAEVGHGRVAFAVADAISRHQPALVVLGRPDYSATPDALVQTTSLDILRASPYPMLVVPHHVESSSPPRRLLLALDGEAFDLGQHAGPVGELLAALQAQITVVHVRDAEGAAPGPEAALLASLGPDLPVTDIRVVSGVDPAEGILRAARPAEYDAVVLIARRRSFLGNLFHRSVTARVLLHSEVPVLVLPAQ